MEDRKKGRSTSAEIVLLFVLYTLALSEGRIPRCIFLIGKLMLLTVQQ